MQKPMKRKLLLILCLLAFFMLSALCGCSASSPQTNQTDGQEPTEDTLPSEAEPETFVNLRGDTISVYPLPDGDYTDGAGQRFSFDGTDTWTDEKGVAWNKTPEGE